MIFNIALILYYTAVAAHIVQYVGVEINNIGNWCGTPVLGAGISLQLHILPLVALVYVHKSSLRKLRAVSDPTIQVKKRIQIEKARMWTAMSTLVIVYFTPLLSAIVVSRFLK